MIIQEHQQPKLKPLQETPRLGHSLQLAIEHWTLGGVWVAVKVIIFMITHPLTRLKALLLKILWYFYNGFILQNKKLTGTPYKKNSAKKKAKK